MKSLDRGQSVKQDAFVVADFRMASGESMPLVLHRDTRLPHTFALRYVIVTYRTPGASPNSIRNVCFGLAAGLSFLEARGIEMMERLATGLFLSRDELADLANRCLSRADGKGAVVTHYAKRRYVDFIDFMLWRFESVSHRANGRELQHLRSERLEFRKRADAQSPKARAGAAERDRKGLTEAQRELLLEIIQPDSPRNPFSAKLRRRNHALILLHYRYGLRAGELAGLYRIDYKNLERPAQLFVHIRDNNPDDRRARPARAKTRPRMLEVAGDAQRALDIWLDHRADRAEFPESRKSRYLFVNKDGVEISERAALGIFERVTSIYPELSEFTSHVLRHDMNERFVEDSEKHGWTPEEVADD